jgi:hypothetical protein
MWERRQLPRSSGSFGSGRCGSRMTDHASDPVDRLEARDSSLAPLAMLGAVAVAGCVTAYLAWPALRSSASLRNQALIGYLRDHLTGSDVALRVVHRLGSMHQGTEDGTLFRRLYKAFEEDRAVVRTLLTQLS